ncbi:hypothetical protein CDAR_94731 [Caerostris darwini]|uniref:Uncharacterized protein n=1 Tax=Caerostris darwini TaxID=1538125 RepID=A0AAV4PIV5_9ARAC|nr:hypothetical protein CDAR_94731 [Caerostris darwini]
MQHHPASPKTTPFCSSFHPSTVEEKRDYFFFPFLLPENGLRILMGKTNTLFDMNFAFFVVFVVCVRERLRFGCGQDKYWFRLIASELFSGKALVA